jgi:hypothetical protein
MELSPYHTTNPHLYNMFVHRKNGHFPEAFEELKTACAEKDQEALWFALYMRNYGGLGLSGQDFDGLISKWAPYDNVRILRDFFDTNPTEEVLLMAVNEKSIFAPFLFIMRRDYFFHLDLRFQSYIDKCCEWNDPYMLYLKSGLHNLLKAVNQNVHLAFQVTIDIFYEQLKYVEAAQIIVKRTGSVSMVYRNIKYALMTKTQLNREKQCFIFGRWLNKRTEPERLLPVFSNSIRIYREAINKVTKACMCWMLICKEMHLYKDVAKMIGVNLWESRENMDEWKVKLKRHGPERKAKRRLKF